MKDEEGVREKQEAPDRVPTGSGSTIGGLLAKGSVGQPSENNLRCELHVEGFSGSDAGCPVEVADGVANCSVTINRPSASRKIDAVEQVEHFRAQLNLHALGNWNVLENGQVDVPEPGAVVLIPGERAEGACGWPKGVRIDPLHTRARVLTALDDVSRKGMVDDEVGITLERISDQVG